jgi:pyridoxine 4-dehydrogenase
LSDTQTFSALAAGTLTIGSNLVVNLVSYGAMRITGSGVWGPPEAKSAALATLHRAVELDVDLIGAIGISGGSGEQDPAVAEAGASAR